MSSFDFNEDLIRSTSSVLQQNSPRSFTPPIVYSPRQECQPFTNSHTSRLTSQSLPTLQSPAQQFLYAYPSPLSTVQSDSPKVLSTPTHSLIQSPTSAFLAHSSVSQSQMMEMEDTDSQVSRQSESTDCNGYDWRFVEDERVRKSIIKWKEKKMRVKNGLSRPKVYERRKRVSETRHRIGGKFVSNEEWEQYQLSNT